VIDQALGILMSRTGSTPDQAFDRLRDRSQTDNVKLREVAQRVVDEAVRRARARHTS
jgi:AmiR/NasT family two-component response regulator